MGDSLMAQCGQPLLMIRTFGEMKKFSGAGGRPSDDIIVRCNNSLTDGTAPTANTAVESFELEFFACD
jgi:hypothetical protein